MPPLPASSWHDVDDGVPSKVCRRQPCGIVPDPDRGWICDVDGNYVAYGDAIFFRRAKQKGIKAAAEALSSAGEIEVVKHTYLRRLRVVARVAAGQAS